MTDHEAELRRRATAAGVFLCWPETVTPTVGPTQRIDPPITAVEAAELLAWLERWTDARRQWETKQDRREYDAVYRDMVLEQSRGGFGVPFQRPVPPPEGFELLQHSWCPRCDRAAGDPLGRRTIGHWLTYFGDGRPEQRKPVRIRPYCEIVPAPPELEIAPACERPYPVGWVYLGHGDQDVEEEPCGARRLFRWGLRRVQLLWSDMTVTISTDDGTETVIDGIKSITWS